MTQTWLIPCKTTNQPTNLLEKFLIYYPNYVIFTKSNKNVLVSFSNEIYFIPSHSVNTILKVMIFYFELIFFFLNLWVSVKVVKI